ncbi:Glycosyltransferase AglE [uncultured archaeon]|nr:Glycosyltransferase AglE [uncultured archaeon]
MAPPLVSVIVPSRNKAAYIGRTLDSVLAQDLQDFEILIYDNGSKDGTQEVAARYSKKDKRISFTQNKGDEGLVFSLNSGLKASKGRYIAVLHCDDVWEPNFLSSSIALLQANPSAGISFCRYRNINEQDGPHKVAARNLLDGPSRLVPSEELFAHYVRRDFSPVCSILTTREAHEKCGGYDPQYPGPCDYQMWLKIASRMDGVYNAATTSSYRIYGENDSNAMIDANVILIEQYSMVLKLFGSFIPPSPARERQKRAMLRNTSLSSLRQALQAIAQNKGGVARSKCGVAVAVYGGLPEHFAAVGIYFLSLFTPILAPVMRLLIRGGLPMLKKTGFY